MKKKKLIIFVKPIIIDVGQGFGAIPEIDKAKAIGLALRGARVTFDRYELRDAV